MSKQSEVIRSHQQTGLAILSKDVILKEQDPKEVTKHIAVLLNRLGKLYLIPGFTEENAVILAEWVYENYKFEELKIVTRCLNNPPTTHDEQGRIETNWRLTPDRIQKWMVIELEKLAAERERENEKYKEQFKEPLPNINYEAYKQRIASGKALQDEPKKTGFENPDYQKFKTELMTKTKRHMCVNIEGMLRNYKGKIINVMEDDNGRTLTDAEARTELARLQSLGHKLMPCGECEGFDPFEKGCPGHPIEPK